MNENNMRPLSSMQKKIVVVFWIAVLFFGGIVFLAAWQDRVGRQQTNSSNPAPTQPSQP